MSGSRGLVSGVALPPREAIDYLRGKTNVTTEHWTDVWRDAHARSFMVAGAATDALVGDFRRAVADALEQGTTLRDFRAQFDDIVRRHGWVHNGSAAWRSRIIYETNLSMAYAAGRYAQQTEPDTLAVYPYWQYVHSGAAHPRLQHQAWNGLVLRADDAFWRTHYPPNGWRCGCRVRVLSARGLARMGRSGPDEAPRIETRRWVNPRTGEVHYVPIGIDPGFDYNPGIAWRGPPQLPGDAVLRPPPGNWPPTVPGGSTAPARRPATPPETAIDRDIVPVQPAEPERPDIPLPAAATDGPPARRPPPASSAPPRPAEEPLAPAVADRADDGVVPVAPPVPGAPDAPLPPLTLRPDPPAPLLRKVDTGFARWWQLAQRQERAPAPFAVGTISTRLLRRWAAATNAPAPAGRTIIISANKLARIVGKDARIGKAMPRALDPADITNLPRHLARPLAVLRQRNNGNLIYVFRPRGTHDGRLAKVVVAVDRVVRLPVSGTERARFLAPQVISAGLTDPAPLRDAGEFTLLLGKV